MQFSFGIKKVFLWSFNFSKLTESASINVMLYFICVKMILQLVISTGGGVNGFTLDPSLGEFILTHPDIKASLLDLNVFPESPLLSVNSSLVAPF